MIRNILVMVTAAGALMLLDDWARARRHQPELQMNYSNWVGKGDRLIVNRPHLDLWVTERKAVLWYCIISPCRANRAAGDMRD